VTSSGTFAGKGKDAEGRLATQVLNLLADRQGSLPVWIRSPKAGVDFYCGFSRAKLYECATSGKIRSVSIREPGQVKGTRLFHLQSILDYIESCERRAVTEAAQEDAA